MSTHTCSLCGLRYPAQSLLDLHIREDHARRDDKPAAPKAPEAAEAPEAAAAPNKIRSFAACKKNSALKSER